MTFLRALIFGALCLTIVNCSNAEPTASSVNSTYTEQETTSASSPLGSFGASCDCNDMECWRKETSEETWKQIECVSDTIGVVGPNWAQIPVLLAKAVNAAINQDGVSALKLAASAVTKGTDGAKCPEHIEGTINGLLSGIDELTSEPKTDSLEKAKQIVGQITNIASTLDNLINSLNTCLPGGSLEAIAQYRRQITYPLQRIAEKVGVLTAIASCGVKVGSGAVTLYNNTQCLLGDLENLAASNESLQAARENLLPTDGPAVHPCVAAGTCDDLEASTITPAATTTTASDTTATSAASDSCYGSSKSCNLWGMRVFGEYLRRQDDSWFETRSYFCASKCGNKGTGVSMCQDAKASLFGSAPAACGAVCDTAQCDSAVDMCVSYCCGQDGSCTSAAHRKMAEYNLN